MDSLYSERNIAEGIKIGRLGWAGHTIITEEEKIPKKILNGNFHTTRPLGRPRARWADVVKRDALQLLGLRGWRSRAEIRDEWRRLMGEAKVRKGLQRHVWMDGVAGTVKLWSSVGVASTFTCLVRLVALVLGSV